MARTTLRSQKLMPPASEQAIWNIALIGNPNTGKSTLFGALVGIHQRVGNYPGVTVEKKTGEYPLEGSRFELVDLPGLYSLAPRSRDEMVAVDLLIPRDSAAATIDAVVCVVDASNLQRHLYLVSQILELGLPTVVALNMLDVAQDHGITLDAERLEQRLGVPVVPLQAHRRIGIDQLRTALASVVGRAARTPESPFPEAFQREVTQMEAELADRPVSESENRPLPRYLVERLLLDVNGYLQGVLLGEDDRESVQRLAQSRARLREAGLEIPGVETASRYDWAEQILEGVVTQPREYRRTASDRIDRVLTHRFWGMLLFALVMIVLFQAVFSWAEPLMGLIEDGLGTAGGWVESGMQPGPLRSLLVDGVIAGVGGVLVFLPQILILFLFIAVLEDCGYMARAAFLMDRVMVRVGLSGKSFIPMLSSFACAIPGIMAARVIENERDRLTTILVAPLMTCSARLPVYSMLIAAFIVPNHAFAFGLLSLQGLVLTSLYVLGIVTAVVAALVLKKTILRSEPTPFLMELPSYKWPSVRTVCFRVLQRGWVFLRCAGTMILAISIVVWAALYYPHDSETVEPPFRRQQEAVEAQLEGLSPGDPAGAELEAKMARIENEMAGEYQRRSVLGKMGQWIEPVVRPLGWDWRIGCAVLASFPAREVVVATTGVIFNLGEDFDSEAEEDAKLMRARLRAATREGTDRPLFTTPVALSLLVFFALCAQCAATLVVIRRETNSWRWPLFTFSYMTALAYLGALTTYQLGTWISGL